MVRGVLAFSFLTNLWLFTFPVFGMCNVILFTPMHPVTIGPARNLEGAEITIRNFSMENNFYSGEVEFTLPHGERSLFILDRAAGKLEYGTILTLFKYNKEFSYRLQIRGPIRPPSSIPDISIRATSRVGAKETVEATFVNTPVRH